MNREELDRLAQNENNIPGIYNYCDRWCERCLYTDRCLNYAMGKEQHSTPESNDMNNKAFWDAIADTMRLTREMIQEDAERLGIDLEMTEEDRREYDKKEKRIKESTEKNICSVMGEKYTKMVNEWFIKAQNLFKEFEDDINQQIAIDPKGCNPERDVVRIEDAYEIIRWYQHQIYVKISRALHGKLDDFTFEGEEEYPKDSDGSAKVSLLGIDRSIAAWGVLRKYVPDEEDSIIDILFHLDSLRRNVEKEFPDARSFIRPGFDDESSRI